MKYFRLTFHRVSESRKTENHGVVVAIYSYFGGTGFESSIADQFLRKVVPGCLYLFGQVLAHLKGLFPVLSFIIGFGFNAMRLCN